jgi:hypothetical protein
MTRLAKVKPSPYTAGMDNSSTRKSSQWTAHQANAKQQPELHKSRRQEQR